MAYLGNAPSQNAIPDLDSVAFTGDGSTTVYTLPLTAGNDASAIVSIDGVRQHTTAYGINDTTLTFTGAPPTGSAIEVVILAVEATIGVPSPNTVGISQLDLSDGTNGQVLKTNGSGVLSFGDDTDTVLPTASTTVLGGVKVGANSSISSGVLAGAAPYSHPTGDGNLHVPATSTSNDGKFLKAGSSAGSLSWATVDALPTQTGNAGKYLTTNATTASWATLDTDANSTTKGLYEMSNTISVNYSISSGNNALTAGPITINSGVSVTVPTGSTWVIA
jgi:acetyltransferase-like isoleucine patch superfamily enzyme